MTHKKHKETKDAASQLPWLSSTHTSTKDQTQVKAPREVSKRFENILLPRICVLLSCHRLGQCAKSRSTSSPLFVAGLPLPPPTAAGSRRSASCCASRFRLVLPGHPIALQCLLFLWDIGPGLRILYIYHTALL